jgi:hypothetical protein
MKVSNIQALHGDMLAAFDRRDLSAYYRLNASIHRAILAGRPDRM